MLEKLYAGKATEQASNSSSNNNDNDNVDLTNETSSYDESDTGQWLLDGPPEKAVPPKQRRKYLNQYILC